MAYTGGHSTQSLRRRRAGHLPRRFQALGSHVPQWSPSVYHRRSVGGRLTVSRRAAVSRGMQRETEPYDVAFSFAGEQRQYVEAVADSLRGQGVSVFYDGFEEVDLWGRDLYAHLDEVYQHRARFCVMFISSDYARKARTNHERRSAQARAFQASAEYILPVRFDETEIPGVLPTVGYIDLRGTAPEALAELILQKLGRGRTDASTPSARQAFRQPKISGAATADPYATTLGFIQSLCTALRARADSLVAQGVTSSLFERGVQKCLRISLRGEVVYSLDVSMGGQLGDRTISFCSARGESSGSGINAWGSLDPRTTEQALELSDLSLLGHPSGTVRYTASALADAIWEKICDAIEARSSR